MVFIQKIITTEISYLNPCCLTSRCLTCGAGLPHIFNRKLLISTCKSIYAFVYILTKIMHTSALIVYAKSSGVFKFVKKKNSKIPFSHTSLIMLAKEYVFLHVQSRFLNLSIKFIRIRTRNTTHQPHLIHSTNQILKLPMFFHPPHPGKVFVTSNLVPNNDVSWPIENYQHLETDFQICTYTVQEPAQNA